MICPICHQEINDGSKFCGKCGNKIPRCPGCGEVIYKRTRYCVNDGTMLSEEILELLPVEEVMVISENEDKKKRKRGKGTLIVKIILTIFIVVALILTGVCGHIAVKGIPSFISEYLGLNEEDSEHGFSDDSEIDNQEEENDNLLETDIQNDEELPEDNIVENINEEQEKAESVEMVHSYEVIAGDFSWQAAKVECENRGGYLATITSQKEYEEISELADNSGLTYLWLGALRYSDTDRWEDGSWITGEQWTFDFWYPGEPSMEDLDGTKEYYLCMWNAKYEGTEIGWTFNDQRNDLVNALPSVSGSVGYICEYENEVNMI